MKNSKFINQLNTLRQKYLDEGFNNHQVEREKKELEKVDADLTKETLKKKKKELDSTKKHNLQNNNSGSAL